MLSQSHMAIVRPHTSAMAYALGRSPALLLALALTGSGGCFDPDHGEDLDLSTTSTGGDEAESSSSGGGDEAAACADYCSLVSDHCADDVVQYAGASLCEATCANIPAGVAGDELGNSVACRTFHAILAAEDAAFHCPHAGPAGAGTCGADCESFCTLADRTCGELSPFAGAEACIAACAAFPTEPAYSADVPDGDSFACRMQHLTLASLQPEIHCAHIGEDSPVCVD